MIQLRATFEEAVWKRVLSADERLFLAVRRWESRFMTRLMCALTQWGSR